MAQSRGGGEQPQRYVEQRVNSGSSNPTRTLPNPDVVPSYSDDELDMVVSEREQPAFPG
jgi:hypothetical protein